MVRRGLGSPYRKLKSIEYLLTRDRRALIHFLTARFPDNISTKERLQLVGRYLRITNHVRGYHTLAEMLTVTDRILRCAGRGPVVVEAGAAKGSSTAKLSLAVQRAGGELHVFDTFLGIPENDEVHENLEGRRVVFKRGAFTGRLAAVKKVVERYGAPEVCHFYKGTFAKTLPGFVRRLDVVLLDVDLLSSTEDCLRFLYPQLRPGGVMFSQDGHLKAIVERLSEPAFWAEIGVAQPRIKGLGTDKLLEIPGPS